MAIGGLKAQEKILPRLEQKFLDKRWSQSPLDWDFLCQDTHEYERLMLSNQGQYIAINDDSTRNNYRCQGRAFNKFYTLTNSFIACQ